jgi:hypothetical protein
MFRKAEAYQAHFSDLTLLVAADFDEWRIFVRGPEVIVHGGRQFNGAKAREHAIRVAGDYLKDVKGEPAEVPPNLEWAELGDAGWLNWRP